MPSQASTDHPGDTGLPAAAELVTVLVPARDEAGSLGACLDSVRAQDHRHLQILVVDNASTDGTAQVVLRHRAQDPRVELVAHPRPGISGALNAGLAQARGRWLVRVDAHSTVGPSYVSLAVERLREPEPVRADRPPVQLAVDLRADPGAPRAHGREQRLQRWWRGTHRGILADRARCTNSARSAEAPTKCCRL